MTASSNAYLEAAHPVKFLILLDNASGNAKVVLRFVDIWFIKGIPLGIARALMVRGGDYKQLAAAV